MLKSDDGEFYVGYAPRPPRRIARTIFRSVVGLNVLAAAIALVFVFAQRPFARSTFEYQQYREFEGVVELKPYPALLVTRTGGTEYSRYLLVSPGKHGADAEVRGFGGKTVRLRGSLIYRDSQTIVEVVPGSVHAMKRGPAAVSVNTLGEVTLTGEIVDSKCYLGVMNPGRTKVHRDCAARCISGGIPPAFVTADGFYLLVGGDGRPLHHEVLDWVGETIQVRGEVLRSGETLILRAEPADFRRIAN
jgi:hypothetical protein